MSTLPSSLPPGFTMDDNGGTGIAHHHHHTQNNYHIETVGNMTAGANFGCTSQSATPATAPYQGRWFSRPQSHREEARRTPTGMIISVLDIALSYMFGSRGPKQTGSVDANEPDFRMVSMKDPAAAPPPYEIYVRTLQAEGHGLPCWDPAPSDPKSQPEGVVPGDVGTYTAEGGFRRSFNLFDNADMIRKIKRATEAGPHRSFQDLNRSTFSRRGMLPQEHIIVEGAFARKTSNSQRLVGVTYEFDRFPEGPAGAILALTSSADKEETSDVDGMGKYISQHAEAIYRHAHGIQRIGKDESLYIVTGCIKSDSWAMAAYRQDNGHGGTLRLEPKVEASSDDPPQYAWTKQGSSRANVGMSRRRGVKDQTLFLLGFKLAFSPQFRSRVGAGALGGDSSNSPGSEARDTEDYHDQSGTPGQGPPSGFSFERGSGGGTAPGNAGHSGHHRCALSSGPSVSLSRKPETVGPRYPHWYEVPCAPSARKGQTCDAEGSSQLHHLSDAINALLLQQTGCHIAICHDDAWRELLKKCHSLLIDKRVLALEDLSTEVGVSGDRAIGTENGVAFLLPEVPSPSKNVEAPTKPPQGVRTPGKIPDGAEPKPLGPVGVAVEQPRLRRDEIVEEQMNKGPNLDARDGDQSQPSPPLNTLNKPNAAPPSNGPKESGSLTLPPLHPTDIVVLVMGLVGAGRSTFINALLPVNHTHKKMAVGTSLTACTTTANCVILDPNDLAPILGSKPSYRLVLVDTPGFDSGYKSDSEGVLQEIVVWADKWLPGGQKRRGGVIFMHDLSADRLQGRGELVAVSNILKARAASGQVVVVTSKWRNVPNIPGLLPEGDRRHQIIEDEIKNTKFHKFREEDTDAREIIKDLLLSIEQGPEWDFGKAFEDMKTRKVKEENSYKNTMKKALKRLVGFFRLWRRAADAV